MSTETWRPVLGWEGMYEVSDHGSVRSVPRLVRTPRRKGAYRAIPGHRLKPSAVKGCGIYEVVTLSKESTQKDYRVHRLVLEAFVTLQPIGMQCRHLDGNPRNNVVGNLVWGTAQENSDDKHLHGTVHRGTAINTAKLTEPEVLSVRAHYAHGASMRDLARMYGLSRPTIRAVVQGRSWTHLMGQ